MNQLTDPTLLPQATLVEPIPAPRGGTIAAIDTGAVGWASVRLGAGRMVKTDKIDHAVGLVLPFKVGDRVKAGEAVGFVHANDADKLIQAREEVLSAITWSDEEVQPLPNFYDTVE